MLALVEIIHYGTITFAVAINAIGVGIGQGLTSNAALQAIDRQPSARADIMRAAILGMALIETAAVLGAFIAGMLIIGTVKTMQSTALYQGLAELGILFAVCLPGLILGIISALPAQAACIAVSRQPFFAPTIVQFMLITLSLIQTPIIFGIITALFIQGQSSSIQTIRDSLRLIASGLAIGLGSVGPAIGLATFAKTACAGIGINRKAYAKILPFTFISEAIIETPIIFAFVVAIILLVMIPNLNQENIIDGIALFSAGLAIGLGTLGPGISSGRTAAAACEQIAWQPDLQATLSRVSMLAQGIIETCVIYAVLISFLLLFFR
jgi:F0F1-type ATP synthase membrane subunit c/vacuolar-type H+-ATPase subunit K